MTYADVVASVGADRAAELRDADASTVLDRGRAICEPRGILLADTKVEFGTTPDGSVILADEVLTPDSSRFWPADQWEPGQAQPSFDKQPLRDWLASRELGQESARPGAAGRRSSTATRERYVGAYEKITGPDLARAVRSSFLAGALATAFILIVPVELPDKTFIATLDAGHPSTARGRSGSA